MSPHWVARGATVMTGAQPETWHDFGGFPRPSVCGSVPAAGAPALAQEVLALLEQAGIVKRGAINALPEAMKSPASHFRHAKQICTSGTAQQALPGGPSCR